MRKIVEIPAELYHIIERATIESNIERCGILIGYKNHDKYVITHIIEDEAARDRSYFGVTRTIQDIWNELNLIAHDFSPSDYVGEWHTHPSGFKNPSFIDIISIISIVNSKDYGYLKDTLLIIGIPKIGLRCWIFSKDGMSKVLLKRIINNINSENTNK